MAKPKKMAYRQGLDPLSRVLLKDSEKKFAYLKFAFFVQQFIQLPDILLSSQLDIWYNSNNYTLGWVDFHIRPF